MVTATRPQSRFSMLPRPFLKWAGGKSQLIPQYVEHFPQNYRNYYEPFVGGGAVFFHLQPQRACLVDINIELVNVYRCVRDRVEDLIAELEIHQEEHCQEHYYEVRSAQMAQSTQPIVTDSANGAIGGATALRNVARAARFIYLNKTCFNGLYRENSKGHFNVPIGSYKKPLICDPDVLRADSEALESTRIEVGSFDIVLEFAQDSQDFVYFDPPYQPLNATSKFTSYSRHSFQEADQVRLRDAVRTLSHRGVKVMLSNSDCPFIRELYQEFNVHTIHASRNINCNAEKRGKITEVLVTTY